jgi:hypothetical protein
MHTSKTQPTDETGEHDLGDETFKPCLSARSWLGSTFGKQRRIAYPNVNNAGIQCTAPVREFPSERRSAIIAVSLTAACAALPVDGAWTAQ